MEKSLNNSNSESDKDKAFNKLYHLQLLLQKESALKELCKLKFNFII